MDNHTPTPLFGLLRAIGFREHGSLIHFESSTLFWSLTRLFECYERVLAALEQPFIERIYLSGDIEHFIIRFRIVLNDIAFVTWQLLPENARGLKGPKGGTHPKNREMSIFELAEFLAKSDSSYPELAAVFAKAASWMSYMKNNRDNVVHYKSQAVTFNTEPAKFALLNAAGTERVEPIPEGGSRLVMEEIQSFAHGQLASLVDFMQTDLAAAIRAHALRTGISIEAVGSNDQMTCAGVPRFNRLRSVGA